MEQEIVRFHVKNAYSSLKRSPPPGVCTALFCQNMTQQRLKIEVRINNITIASSCRAHFLFILYIMQCTMVMLYTHFF